MERARKMVIVPEEVYKNNLQQDQQTTSSYVPLNNITESESVQTPGDNLSRLDAEMVEILNSKKYLNEQDKCKHYLQVLRRYLFFKDHERERDSMNVTDEVEAALLPLSEEAVIESVPKIYVQKARRLIKHLKSHEPGRFKWENTGTVILDNKLISGSNITELLNSVLKKKVDDLPTGFEEFKNFIASSETPENLIGNKQVLNTRDVIESSIRGFKRKMNESVFNTPPRTRLMAKKKWLSLAV